MPSRPTEALTPDTIVARHPEQITAAVDDEVILMGLIRGQYVGLDDVGSVLWRLLEQPQKVADLCDRLGRHYRGAPAVIASDVTAFLEELRTIDLIEVLDAVPAAD